MNHVFRAGPGSVVPDGTRVSPFLNPTDSASGLPAGMFEGASLAIGALAPGQRSRIHLHPLVTMVTWVIEGRLQIRMKDAGAPAPYLLSLEPEDAALTHPGTFVQLINPGETPCRVLYVCSPGYVWLQGADGRMVYDDAQVFDDDWYALAARGYPLPAAADIEALRSERRRAIAMLARQKRDALE